MEPLNQRYKHENSNNGFNNYCSHCWYGVGKHGLQPEGIFNIKNRLNYEQYKFSNIKNAWSMVI